MTDSARHSAARGGFGPKDRPGWKGGSWQVGRKEENILRICRPGERLRFGSRGQLTGQTVEFASRQARVEHISQPRGPPRLHASAPEYIFETNSKCVILPMKSCLRFSQGLEDSVSSWFDGDSMQSFFEFQVTMRARRCYPRCPYCPRFTCGKIDTCMFVAVRASTDCSAPLSQTFGRAIVLSASSLAGSQRSR